MGKHAITSFVGSRPTWVNGRSGSIAVLPPPAHERLLSQERTLMRVTLTGSRRPEGDLTVALAHSC